MARLREDPRFRAVQPDAFDTDGGGDSVPPALVDRVAEDGTVLEEDEGLELWFDWAFVDFWKNHYCQFKATRGSGKGPELTMIDTIQRSIAIEPDAKRGSGREFARK